MKLGEVAEIRGRIGYRGYRTEDLVAKECGALVIGGKHISQNRLDLSDPDYLSWAKFLESPEIAIEEDDIIIAQRGTLGRSALVKYDIGKATINPSVLILRHKLVNARFLHYTLLKDDSISYVMRCASKTSIPMISQKQLGDMPIYQASLEEQEKIASFLSLIDERIEVQNAIIKEREVAKTLLSKELLTPEDDWTEYAVQDCLTYEQPAKYIVKHTDYSSDSTLTPVLTANKGFILGYTSEQGIYQKGACIIFDDFTLDCKYVPFAFKVKSSAIKILQARKGFDIRFMFEVIKSLSLSPFAHKRHYISEVEPIKILVPSFAKQEKIARLFEALDERLAVEKEYATLLQKQKAYLLRQMFV